MGSECTNATQCGFAIASVYAFEVFKLKVFKGVKKATHYVKNTRRIITLPPHAIAHEARHLNFYTREYKTFLFIPRFHNSCSYNKARYGPFNVK